MVPRKKLKIKVKKKLPIKIKKELSDEEKLARRAEELRQKVAARDPSLTTTTRLKPKYTAPQIREMDERVRNLERLAAAGDNEAQRRLNKEKERANLLTLKIFKSPGTYAPGRYHLYREDWDGEIGAAPIVTEIPVAVREKAEKYVDGLNRGACPLKCYGTPGCPLCRSVQAATEIHQLLETGELYNMPKLPAHLTRPPPTWQELENHSWVDDDSNLL